MRVLGIDPGYDRMGVCVIEQVAGKESVLFSACLTTDKKLDFSDRLLYLGQKMENIVKKWQPTVMATEKLFLANNQKTAMRIAETRGMIIYLARKYGLSLAEYTPLQIKQTICGYGAADKKQMTGMIGHLVKMPDGKRLDDEYDAIGIALTHLACYRTKDL